MSKKDDPNYYEFPYRKNYELRIAALWIATSFALFITPLVIDVPFSIYYMAGVASLIIAVLLGRNGIELAIRKSRLKGYKVEAIDPTAGSTLALFGIKDKEVIKNVTRKQRR